MTIITRNIEYTHDGVTLEGVLAYDDAQTGPRPGVLVSHAWAGRSDFEVGRAKALAEMGYVGFALDLYGKGVLGTSAEENEKLMTPLVENQPLLTGRLNAAVDAIRAAPEVDEKAVAAIGYCFGGLCVLTLARTGADLKGVVSLHGLLGAGDGKGAPITAKVLVLHGWDDPMVPPDAVITFTEEMTAAKADWQLHAYGGTMHSFTNPAANDPGFGTVYSPSADQRSWATTGNFLAELFS
ncbi:MAG: dienelactone hydrolase family protein [Pseudomonadota bacterium]